MKCTACDEGNLVAAYLDGLFACQTCDSCGGNLLMLSDYLRWRENNKDHQIEPGEKVYIEADETSKVMICPITGKLMTKYLFSAENEHRLDLSPSINAIWMDKGEWELLKNEGAAGNLGRVFTGHWQKEIRSMQSEDVMESLYARRFGEHYEAVKQFRKQLESLDNKHEIIAYLAADDPYRP